MNNSVTSINETISHHIPLSNSTMLTNQNIFIYRHFKGKCTDKKKLINEWDSFTMGYFDNIDNGPLNKYKKKYRCVLLVLD
jgi:hypothetical protein